MPFGFRIRRLALVLVALAALVALCRGLGFGEGVLLGITPASGLALSAALVLRRTAILAIIAGFALGDALAGLSPAEIVTDAVAHGAAALLGAWVMRQVARQVQPETKTQQWLIFAGGVCASAATVAMGFGLAQVAGLVHSGYAPQALVGLTLLYEALGLLTFSAIVLNLREAGVVRANPQVTLAIASFGIVLLGALWILLSLPLTAARASDMAVLLSLPIALWIAMQPRSLDGAAITFVVMHAALFLLVSVSGAVTDADFVVTILYLVVLTVACQLIHSVNLDRLAALAENRAHKRELEMRVEERTARLRAMTERAIAADGAKSKFLATVSHELRTPLNGVIGMASLVLSRELDPRTRANVELIHGSGLHLLGVINRILDFSRLGHEGAPESETAFDLAVVLREVVEEARFSADAQGLVLSAEVAPGLPTLRRGLRQGMRQVLTNLVGNAVKFTDAGCVSVRLSAIGGDWVRGEVQDSGIGIAGTVRDRIFRPFEQADDTVTRRYGGTGLGLAICAETLARMGGRIGVESEPGTGSIFWFEVPLPRAERAGHDFRLQDRGGAA